MSHTVRDRERLLNRVRRIRGQIEAVERSLESDAQCSEIIHRLTATRGALNSLLAGVLVDHVRGHLVERSTVQTREQAGDELIDVINSYFK